MAETLENQILHALGQVFDHDKDKNIIRKKLKIDVFNSTKIKKKLESILHPIILSRCKELVNEYKSEEYVVVVIPLLFETKSYLELIDESLLIENNIQLDKFNYQSVLDLKLILTIQGPEELKLDDATAEPAVKTPLDRNVCTVYVPTVVIVPPVAEVLPG